MDSRWMVAAGLVAGGFVVGALAGMLLRRRLARTEEGGPASVVAGAAGMFVFWFFVLLGILLATALVRPETLEDLPRSVIDYTPRLLVAGLILIAGYAIGVAAASVVAFGLERASGRTVVRTARLVRWGIFAAALILALAQLGVDTTILILLVAIVGFGLAASAALLTGLGGQHIAENIAAGRYLRRIVPTGSVIEAGPEAGRVMALHPATIELETETGVRRHVAYADLLRSGITVRRSGPADDDRRGQSTTGA